MIKSVLGGSSPDMVGGWWWANGELVYGSGDAEADGVGQGYSFGSVPGYE